MSRGFYEPHFRFQNTKLLKFCFFTLRYISILLKMLFIIVYITITIYRRLIFFSLDLTTENSTLPCNYVWITFLLLKSAIVHSRNTLCWYSWLLECYSVKISIVQCCNFSSVLRTRPLWNDGIRFQGENL